MAGNNENQEEQDLELQAMATVYGALKTLNGEAQTRVLDYVMKRLSLKLSAGPASDVEQKQVKQNQRRTGDAAEGEEMLDETSVPNADTVLDIEEDSEGLEGISPVAQKWMRRNGFSDSKLSSLFSLGVDEIDLVASSVPGKSIKDKFRSVLLLQGVASYLGSGAPRIDANKLKQAAGHYGADPERNWSTYMKSLSSEVSGSNAGGFTLTARGLKSATELIKNMAAST